MCGGVIMSELYRVASALCHMEATIQDENYAMDSTDKLSIIYTCVKICQQALGNYLDAHDGDSKIGFRADKEDN